MNTRMQSILLMSMIFITRPMIFHYSLLLLKSTINVGMEHESTNVGIELESTRKQKERLKKETKYYIIISTITIFWDFHEF